MSTATRAEPYLTPKEVQARMEEQGVRYSVPYWRAVLRQCPASIRRGRFARWSDVWAWWLLNPDWSPYARNQPPQAGLG
jgi:hypothetical protein